MKGKHLAILLLLVAVFGGAWYFLFKSDRAGWSESGGAGGKVVEFPINEVATLVIKSSDGEVTLVRAEDVWTVKERADYPANFEQLSELLRKLWDLKTVQEVKAGASQLPRLELVEPGQGEKAGTLVELKDKDGKTLNALLLGKKHMKKSEGGPMDFGGFASGRYVKTLSGTKISLVSESFDNVEPKPASWLQKDFVKVTNPKSISVAGPTDAQKWTVTRDEASGEWKLADAKEGEKADAAKTAPLASVFASPTFTDVLAADAKPEDTGLDQPTTATIATTDGFRYELKIGKANGENYPVQVAVSADFPKERPPGKDEKPEDKAKLDEQFAKQQKELQEKLAKEKKYEGRTYLVPKFAVEPLLKDRAALFADKPAETTGTPPAPGEPGAPPFPSVPGAPGGPSFPPAVPDAANTPPPGPPPTAGARRPITVTTPPVSVPAQPNPTEAVTPPVQAPPLTPAPVEPAKEMPPEPKKDAAPADPSPAPAPAKEVAPAPPKEAPTPAPEPPPAKDEAAPKP